jgi:hypothetical protein
MGHRPPHLARPACPFTARACGPFLFRRFAPLAASVAHCPPAASAVRPVITAGGAPPKPPGSPPRPACGLARCFPPPCPSKPATARLAASLARPVTAPAPPPRLDGPPRPAEARRGVTARQGAPKPATGRGRPLAPAVRPPPPPSPPAVAARPRGAPAVRLPLARRRPPWRADHRRPPPSGAPQPRPPPARKKGRKKVVKNPYCKFFALRKPCKNPFLQLVFITGFGRFLGYGPKLLIGKKVFNSR